MKNLLLALSFLTLVPMAHAQDSWTQSSVKDENGKKFQLYTLLSDNKDNNGQQLALMIVSPKENSVSKLGFAFTEGSISCNNYCQYYIKFDDTASKYTFSIENKAIKLQNDQKDDFLINLKKSKDLTLILDKQRFYFTVSPLNFRYVNDLQKNKD